MNQEIEMLRSYAMLKELINRWGSPELLQEDGVYKITYAKFKDVNAFPEISIEEINPIFRARFRGRTGEFAGFTSKSFQEFLEQTLYISKYERTTNTPIELYKTIGEQLGHGGHALHSFGEALDNECIQQSLLGQAYLAGNRISNAVCSRATIMEFVSHLCRSSPDSIPKESEEKFEIARRTALRALAFKDYATRAGISTITRLVKDSQFDVYLPERELDPQIKEEYKEKLCDPNISLMFFDLYNEGAISDGQVQERVIKRLNDSKDPLIKSLRESTHGWARIDLATLLKDEEEIITRDLDKYQEIIQKLAQP